jgi:hypothetical protein
MNKEFIPYEQALELKELGFDEPCIAIWIDIIPLPLYQQVFRWFREKYDLNVFVYANTHISIELSLTEPRKYFYLIDTEEGLEESKDFNTYEEAELECLKQLIETTKNK